MAKFLLRLDDEIYKRITAKAAEAKRSLNKHIEMIIERDLITTEIPTISGVIVDGKVIWNEREKKWGAPITIDEELDRR